MDRKTGLHCKADGDYLYSVVNLSKTASQAEIHERYRSLSLLFHPDKQTDENLKNAATKEFLEIQKAYEVLSDPFLRQVYDTLGSEGLAIKWPPTLRFQTQEKILEVLIDCASRLTRHRLNQIMVAKANVHCSIDASPLFDPHFVSTSQNVTTRLRERVQAVHAISQNLAYTIEKQFNDKTKFTITGEAIPGKAETPLLAFMGTIRHQFSPRFNILAAMTFAHPYPTRFEVNYEASGNIVNFKTAISPFVLGTFPPVLLSFSRQLFRSTPQRAKVDLNLTQHPSLSLFYISPPVLKIDKEDSLPQLGPPTTLGIKYVAFERAYGVVFDRVLPTLVAETSMTLLELSIRLKASIQLGVTGALYSLGAHWSSESLEAGTSLILDPTSLLLKFDVTYLQQQLSLPIILSTQYFPLLVLGTALIPSAAALLVYRFFVIPRRRGRRYAHIQAAKKAFEEDSDSRRERNAVESLLKDAVKKQVRHETEAEGLIIQEATYGVAEAEFSEGKEALSLDVTIPLQALVRKSQLHIPGGISKAALQGFSDPAPFASKALCIRYLFRGRMHYAEIPDYLPVVLPLSGRGFPWINMTVIHILIDNLNLKNTW